MNRLIFIVCLLWSVQVVQAWDWWPLPIQDTYTGNDTLCYDISLSGIASSGTYAPFLMYANQHGRIATDPFSGNLSAGVKKSATLPTRWYDWDAAAILEGRIQGAKSGVRGTGFCKELYAHTRLYIVDITIGIHPFRYGPAPTDMSMGNLILSSHAHPMPRITIGIDQWTAFPGLYGYVDIKGGLTHGWLNDSSHIVQQVKFHHKFAGIRVGNKLPVQLSYELHHAVQWGGYSKLYGDLGNDWNSFKNIFWGRSGGTTTSDQLNAQGNHMLSQILALTIQGKQWNIHTYWQNIQEDGRYHFIGCGQNAADGLWGIHVQQSAWPYISAFTYEFANTTDQSGPFHDKDGLVYGGNDSYYINSAYHQGWTYWGKCMGLSLATPDCSRIMAHYMGVSGDIYGYTYRLIAQIAEYLGTYRTPFYSTNTALMCQVSKHVPQAWDLDFSIALAADFGNKYGNSVGVFISVAKQGIITQWGNHSSRK